MSDFALVPSDLGCSFCKWMADIGRTCECALKPCHQFVRILPARATVWVVDRRSTQKLLTRSQLEFPLLACKRKSEPVGVRSLLGSLDLGQIYFTWFLTAALKIPGSLWFGSCIANLSSALWRMSQHRAAHGVGQVQQVWEVKWRDMVTAWDSGCSDSSGTEWPAASWCWLLQIHVLPGVFPRHFRSISVTLVFKVHLPQAAGSN